MTDESTHNIGLAIGKLVDRLMVKQAELTRRETSCGTYHDVHKMTALRAEIDSLQRRIVRAERLQDAK